MAAKRVFDLNEASIVDLKAELIRKESEFKREKLAGTEQKINRQHKKPPVCAKVKKETKDTGSKTNANKQDELSLEEQQALQKSRQVLEAKAALYEKMAKGEIEDEDDGEDGGRFLVDFHKKVYSKDEESHQDSDTLKDEDIPPPSGPEEEWVDYVDSLGRFRRCLQKDLKHLQEMDKDISNRQSPPTLLSEDMRRELMRQKWEKEEEEALNKPVGPVHYQDIRFDEVRNHGVGYYQFSTIEEERQEQMKTLDKLREQTMEQRLRAQKLKDKRKAALDARLAKVRERKLKKLKSSGEVDEEIVTDSEQTGEHVIQTSKGGSTVEQSVEEKSVDKEMKEIQEGFPIIRSERKPDLPEWAKHKIKQTDRGGSFSRSDPRSERVQEFAPPVFYYEDTKDRQAKRLGKNQQSCSKIKMKQLIKDQNSKTETLISVIKNRKLTTKPRYKINRQTPVPPLPEFLVLPPPPQEYVQQQWTGYQWQPPAHVPPPPLPHQLPWQPRFPINVPPPPPSLWQQNFPSWQPPQGPPSMGAALFPKYHSSWNESAPSSYTFPPNRTTESNTSDTVAIEKSDTGNIEKEKCPDRTAPSTQQVADFVAQLRSSS
ncbi:hypothetical protein ABFA07_005047 [Porites harrisoni]